MSAKALPGLQFLPTGTTNITLFVVVANTALPSFLLGLFGDLQVTRKAKPLPLISRRNVTGID